ncbi:hypothetical protein AVEN_96893-1 [Araneus ventricosus]|uniref:Uncharacterized protein n=1 Tax=Araneus ventricosus TaxID=182803 RepID=A0A4Y2FZS2_ARAVE|nr:hypothetical protein AVEN_96893-1 [Araneus ventricosus]
MQRGRKKSLFGKLEGKGRSHKEINISTVQEASCLAGPVVRCRFGMQKIPGSKFAKTNFKMVNRKLNYATTSVLMNAISVGLASTYSSTAIESMKNGKLNPDDDEVSWIGSCLPFGAIIGGAIAGNIMLLLI